MDFLMRKRIVSAAEALEMGLVHEVAEPEKLVDRALALARRAGGRPSGGDAHVEAGRLQRGGDDLRAVVG